MKLDVNQDYRGLTDEALLELVGNVVAMQEVDRREFALHYYEPANKDIAKIHDLTCGTIGIFGGNGSGKTEHALVEGIIRCTGIVPASLSQTYPRQKLRGPIHMRVVCESLTTVLDPIILPKLQWMTWSGIPQSETQGHWGWVPRHCLIGGDWKKSYNARLRTLTVAYRNEKDVITGWSTIQFMSYDQDSTDFASGDIHYCLHDEPPKVDIWNENQARVMRGGTGSTILVSMTWPDNPAMPVDWIFDKIFDKGTPGPYKDPDVEIINIDSTNNPHLDQVAVAKRASQMSAIERNTRIHGLPIRFSNRIHPDFTDKPRMWCFECGTMVIPGPNNSCSICHGTYVTMFSHVGRVMAIPRNPCICLLDPHPRKPHMLAWVQLTPNEDFEVVAERLVSGGIEDVRDVVKEVEADLKFYEVIRLMDPNMGASPSGSKRDITWQMEFDSVGLHFDLADDSDVGRSRLNDFLKPDPHFMRARFKLDESCTTSIFQMNRYVWAENKNADTADVKQVPMKKNDDFPTLYKYLMNRMPQYTANYTNSVVKRDRGNSGYKAKGLYGTIYAGR